MTDDEFAEMLKTVSLKETREWFQDLIDRNIVMIGADGKLVVEGKSDD